MNSRTLRSLAALVGLMLSVAMMSPIRSAAIEGPGDWEPQQYVALGDSFQSGEGAGNYLPETNNALNMCRRSTLAYPYELSRVSDYVLDFGACSGAKIADLSEFNDPTGPPWNDWVSQYERLGPETKLVTIGIGGNDVHFAEILGLLAAANPDRLKVDQAFNMYLNAIHPPVGPSQLQGVYETIRLKAPNARILVVGYPYLFVPSGVTVAGNEPGRCSLYARVDQLWMNSAVSKLNQAVRDAAADAPRVQYVDSIDAFAGHELCGAGAEAVNGLRLPDRRESFHPNALGHQLLAAELASAYREGAVRVMVQPDQAVTRTYQVQASSSVSFWATWPGSDVAMSLLSPSGRTIDAATVAADVRHNKGATYESFTVTAPEPGTWTVSLYGMQVSPGGEPTDLAVFAEPVPNSRPLAKLNISQTGRIITFDSSGSTDADGTIQNVFWDFGDGRTSNESVSSHTYASAGTYSIGLSVTDNAGGSGFVWQTVTVPADTTGPTIAWVNPIEDGAVFDFGMLAPQPSCTALDEVGGSGVNAAGCVVTGYGTAVGDHKLTATATDNEGNTTTLTRAYTVRPTPVSPSPPPTATPTQTPVGPTAPAPTPTGTASAPGPGECVSCARATAKATNHRSRMTVTVVPRCGSQYRFRIERRVVIRSGGSDEPTTTVVWRLRKGSYLTRGQASSRTVDLPKGTYRAVVSGACGNSGTTSNAVTLRR